MSLGAAGAGWDPTSRWGCLSSRLLVGGGPARYRRRTPHRWPGSHQTISRICGRRLSSRRQHKSLVSAGIP